MPLDLEAVCEKMGPGAYIIAHEHHLMALRHTEEGCAINVTDKRHLRPCRRHLGIQALHHKAFVS